MLFCLFGFVALGGFGYSLFWVALVWVVVFIVFTLLGFVISRFYWCGYYKV